MHVVTVGWSPELVRDLWNRLQLRVDFKISHIAHPSHDRESWIATAPAEGVSFLREQLRTEMPAPDRQLLASLEAAGVPTIHNMILSDRFLAKLPYEDALSYATFLARRLVALFSSIKPDVVIGGFDLLHGSLGFAVAKSMGIPWFVLNFSSLPSGQAAFCSDLSPASKVLLEPGRAERLRSSADRLLKEFEGRTIHAAAYIPPRILSAAFIFKRIPAQMKTFLRIARRRRVQAYLKYTNHANTYSLSGLFREAIRLRLNIFELPKTALLDAPPRGAFAFFGLHMQPESSIDVFAHFFSNQLNVVELISRSLPPTHLLLVKLHKSDVPNYSRQLLERFSQLPAVRLVSPYADTFEFIRQAELVFSIQGTIGLEGALLGKPVVMFGDSPMKVFPNVSTVGRNPDLPGLVSKKLGERNPSRDVIIESFANYLAPFYPASKNDWSILPTDQEIENYASLFALLRSHLGMASASLNPAVETSCVLRRNQSS